MSAVLKGCSKELLLIGFILALIAPPWADSDALAARPRAGRMPPTSRPARPPRQKQNGGGLFGGGGANRPSGRNGRSKPSPGEINGGSTTKPARKNRGGRGKNRQGDTGTDGQAGGGANGQTKGKAPAGDPNAAQNGTNQAQNSRGPHYQGEIGQLRSTQFAVRQIFDTGGCRSSVSDLQNALQALQAAERSFVKQNQQQRSQQRQQGRNGGRTGQSGNGSGRGGNTGKNNGGGGTGGRGGNPSGRGGRGSTSPAPAPRLSGWSGVSNDVGPGGDAVLVALQDDCAVISHAIGTLQGVATSLGVAQKDPDGNVARAIGFVNAAISHLYQCQQAKCGGG